MQWLMTFRIALRALARNKLRAFLTMLGIIIGVGAVIAMVAIGEGAKSTIRSQIASSGHQCLDRLARQQRSRRRARRLRQRQYAGRRRRPSDGARTAVRSPSLRRCCAAKNNWSPAI